MYCIVNIQKTTWEHRPPPLTAQEVLLPCTLIGCFKKPIVVGAGEPPARSGVTLFWMCLSFYHSICNAFFFFNTMFLVVFLDPDRCQVGMQKCPNLGRRMSRQLGSGPLKPLARLRRSTCQNVSLALHTADCYCYTSLEGSRYCFLYYVQWRWTGLMGGFA